jgi:hypothetical protein
VGFIAILTVRLGWDLLDVSFSLHQLSGKQSLLPLKPFVWSLPYGWEIDVSKDILLATNVLQVRVPDQMFLVG